MLPRVIRIQARDSSVGRAGDCSVQSSELSLGHWFKSGSRDLFFHFFNKIQIFKMFEVNRI
jgi:hypothetical protein